MRRATGPSTDPAGASATRADPVRALRGDGGQSLVFVLAVLAAFGLLLPAMLAFASTGLVNERSFTLNARAREAANAGIENALIAIKSGAGGGATATPVATAVVLPDGNTASVTFASHPVTSLAILPAGTLTVATCAPVLLTAIDQGSVAIPYGGAWSATATGAGTGTMDNGGAFTPRGPADTYVVNVRFANLKATRSVVVSPSC
ncbi:MAG: hypothetical protein ABR525_06610 [Candidatus Limnocylindria bacterium]